MWGEKNSKKHSISGEKGLNFFQFSGAGFSALGEVRSYELVIDEVSDINTMLEY